MSRSRPGEAGAMRMTLTMLLLILGLIAVFIYQRWRSGAGAEAMQTVASEWGLQVERSGKRSRLFGRIDGVGVEVRHSTERTADEIHYFTRFKVFAPDAPPGRIEAASLRQRVLNSLSDQQPVLTGDAGFDEAVRVYGPEQVMREALDAEARPVVLAAIDAGWALDSATWQASEAGFVTDAAALRSLLELGLAAHHATRIAEAAPGSVADGSGTKSWKPSLLDAKPPAPTPTTHEEALTWLASNDVDKAFEAAVMLAATGNDDQAVRLPLVGALPDRERQPRAIAALAKVGGKIEAMALRAVRGEHQAAAQAAAVEIEARQ